MKSIFKAICFLSEPECYTGRQDEVLMFCRRWKPDLLVFDPMKEILIPNCTNKQFMQLVTKCPPCLLSSISREYVDWRGH